MTSESLNSSTERGPFLLAPSGKDYLWGGERLNDDFNKDFDCSPLAETWECSTHPDGESVVRSGPFTGLTLRELLELHPDYLGTNLPDSAELPVLVKFIDARHDLSVQVHPTMGCTPSVMRRVSTSTARAARAKCGMWSRPQKGHI